eukprot:TRINITY_DN10111_c0_g1_i1.p2 TRINITY_DN10111_c0_g1~~TRINITY_DN10111_c0_g1_i1.p2  ORF type:complete len:234 (+),score=69.24 TRINITY_DN10111_c0_g1_i1:1299-2000(+)
MTVKKKFRKRISDLQKTGRVGPYDENEDGDDDVPSTTTTPTKTIDSSKKEVVEKEKKDIFGSLVSKVLNESKDAEGGFLGGYSLKEQKAEARAKRRLEKKRVKRKRAFEVEGGTGYISESSESEASEDEAVKRRKVSDRRMLRKHILSQSHNKEIPSLAAPDYEKRLRRVATNGVVRLFNAVAQAQNQATSSSTKSDPKKSESSGGPPKAAVTRSKFLEMLKKGSDNKDIQVL